MSAIPAAILKRRPTWHPSQAPPPHERPLIHKLDGGRLIYSAPGAGLRKNSIDESRMAAAAIITCPIVDRVGDIVRSEGCRLDQYQLNDKWFFGHQSDPIPVGKAHYKDGPVEIHVSPEMVWGWCFFDEGEREGPQYFRLVKDEIITAVSLAFDPASEPIRLNHPNGMSGWDYEEWWLIENTWCGVPCNWKAGRVDVVMRDRSRLLRSYLSKGKIEGERIAPLVRKALEPLAEPKRAWLGWERRPVKQKYITHNGSKYVVHAESGKVLGTHDNAADAKRQLAAIEAHKHGGKAMASSSGGTDGGYLGLGGTEGESGAEMGEGKHPHGVTGIEKIPEEHHETVKAIAHVMMKHEGTAHPDGPHDAYLHPEKGHVWHHHHKDASEDHLEKVKDDMELIDGVHDLTQHHETPNESGEKGFHKVYQKAEGESEEEVTPKPEPAGEVGEVKWSKALAKNFKTLNKLPGNRMARKLLRRRLKRYIKAAKEEHKDVEECVKHKIPKLIAEGYPQDQAEAIAFSMCGEKKAFERGEEEEEEYDGDDGKEDGPALASLIADLVSCVVALQEHATPEAPPPPREINDEEEEHDDEENNGMTEAERTNAAMARYQRSGKGLVRKMHPKHKEDLLSALGGASDHLHKMGDLEREEFGHRHIRDSKMHARILDRHHGMISGMKDEPPPMRPNDMPPEEHAGEADKDDDFLDEKTARAILQKLDSEGSKLTGMEASIRRINPSLLR